jgi:mono/diheme cytochrome c family protein
MKRIGLVVLFLCVSWMSSAWAQQSEGALTAQQQQGRQLLAQSCGVCHLQASMNAKTYGPPLNKASGNGNNDILRTFIMEGTPRMPGFKHYLKPAEVDAIIAYVRTVPVPIDTAATR